MTKRQFLVTVDVEALRSRAHTDHAERLIWGRFPADSGEYGLKAMIKAGDEIGVPFTFYLDFAERYVHGNTIDDAARTIKAAGHDLQLHVHSELLPETFWRVRGLTQPEGRRYHYSKAHCDAVMETLVNDMEDITGQSPEAYRAGAFQVNKAWLDSAARCGIAVSSNHCYASWMNQKRTPIAGPEEGIFRWKSGLFELPVTQVMSGEAWKTLAIPMSLPEDPNFLKTFRAFAEAVDGPPVVLLLHSWSLLKYSGDGKKFGAGSPEKVDRLKRILSRISELFEPISTCEFAKRAAAGCYGDKPLRDYPASLERG